MVPGSKSASRIHEVIAEHPAWYHGSTTVGKLQSLCSLHINIIDKVLSTGIVCPGWSRTYEVKDRDVRRRTDIHRPV